MNSILNLIQKYNKQGIIFIVKNNKLTIKTEKDSVYEEKDSINEEKLLEIKKNKQQIIDFFKNNVRVLSYAQERLWFIDQYAHNDSYNLSWAIKLSGKLDVNVLEKTFFEIIRRHEILRTNIVTINNVACQLIHEKPKFQLTKIDQSHLTNEEAYQNIQNFIEIESQKPFDLANDSLIGAVLFKISYEEHILFLNKHHIVSDGWSFTVFFKEISILYKAYSENKPSPLPELEIQYADYAVWQRDHIKGETLSKQSEYWKNKLSGTGFLEMPTDRPRPVEQTFNGATLHFNLGKDILKKLNDFAKVNDVTPFMTLLSVFNVLLHKYTSQEDICIGTPIANRTRSEIEPLLGFFVNTLALRSDLSGGISFIDLVQQVKQTTLEAYDNQDIPFEKVVDIIQPERNLAYTPLFQVVMVLQNNPESEFSMGELSIKSIDLDVKVSKFDFTINFTEKAEGLVVGIEYNTDLFNKARINRMIEHFKVLFNSIVANPEQKISNIAIIPPEEKQKLIVEWKDTNAVYPKDKCIHQIFEEQAGKMPDNIAVVFEDQQLTYKELNEKSNQLAHYLQEKGVKPDSLVGICVDRSLEMIVGLVGILKAGGAYVPIDPTYPEERVSYMLEDADCEIVLTQAHIELPQINSEIIYLDGDWDKIKNESDENVKSGVKSDNLAYVIYTSGSTGRPKGTLIEHRNVVRLLLNDKFQFSFTEKDVWSLFHSFCFDFSVWEMYGALLYGGKLIVIPKESTIDIEQFSKILEKHKVTVLNQTPSVFYNLSDIVERNKTVLAVRYVIFGAEALKPSKLSYWYEKYPTCKLINMYGITETTVHVTYKEITRHEIENNTCNIGKPIPTLSTYILDENQNIQPIGVPGELCVSGAGLSRGYLNNEKLTSAKFRNNPFAKGEKIYHSGDLAYINETGELIYCGRIDSQVKIRGFRIELGEIEAAINKMETIKDCVVVAKDDANGNNRLVAYLVSDEELNEQMIRGRLSKTLPDYMVPSMFMKLEKLPLTPNGKIDRKALPEPEVKAGEDYHAPSSQIEERLVGIWSEILNIDKNEISINKSFFEIGGNSLLTIKLQKKLVQLNEFKHITIPDLFKYHTVNMLAQSIQSEAPTEYILQNKTHNSNNEIAIIGMSGAFSGVNNIADYWRLLKNREEGIHFYSKEECKKKGVNLSDLENPDYISVTGKVDNIELFDPAFWDISPNEAKLLDPQIRKFIEHCWYVLETSGYIHKRNNHSIGVFAGSGNSHYLNKNVINGEMASQVNIFEASLSNSKDALATKTSYMLGLSGPANSINTACSTSLVSVIEACHYLQLGSCDMAIAGGVSLSLPDQIGYIYQEGMISSKDGHCRTFDEDASGTTGGSGVGVVLLKRLEDAIKSNDNIIGVIKGYATNNDGNRKTGYMAPSVTGQSECIINAQKMAGISSGEVDYVECHGSATNLGDPIEVQALKEAFEFNKHKANKPKQKTILGAVKANIGHANSAAGIAGLIKACLMLQNNLIPGQPNFNTPNPKLNIRQTNFEIAKENKEWLAIMGKQRIAGISAFGIGGTNAHVIIGDYIPNGQNNQNKVTNSVPSMKDRDGLVNFIIPISAKSIQSLKFYKEKLVKYLTEADKQRLDIKDIAYTLQEKREHFKCRSAYRAMNIDELINSLKEDRSFKQVYTEIKNKNVFMFPGQGAQYPGMAKGLYNNDPFFKTTIDKLIMMANQYLEVDLYEVMYPKEGKEQYDINETKWTQISMFIIEYALAEYVEHLGIQADAYIGHSLGEYVAAALSGVFTLEDAIQIVVARGELMQMIPPGSMLAIEAKEEIIREILKGYDCEISIVNSEDDIVVSGNENDINKLKEELDKQAIPAVMLNISIASHSKMVEQIISDFESVFKDIKLKKPVKHFISNVSGEIAKEEVSTVSYWCQHLRNTVQFAKGINSICKHFNHQISFIEIGPDDGLDYFVNKYRKVNNKKSIKNVKILPSSIEGGNKTNQKIEYKEDLIAKLWTCGVIETPNDLHLFEQAKPLSDLPTYQFEFKKCWLEATNFKAEKRFNSLDDMCYKRSWERMDLPSTTDLTESLKQKNILILINDKDIKQSGSLSLINALCSYCDNVGYVVHQKNNNIIPDSIFDLSNDSHVKEIFNKKTRTSPIDIFIYISSSIDIENSGLDIFAIRNAIEGAIQTRSKIPKIVSISFDNYEVIGNENLQEKPSIIYGVAKSLPVEYLTMDIVAYHIDLSLSDTNNIEALISTIAQNQEEELAVIRGKYKWIPKYQQIDFHKDNSIEKKSHQPSNRVFLITGGLGGVGYAYANYLTQNEKDCTIILLGRTLKSDLREDYKIKLENLLKTKHKIIYAPIDIGLKNSFDNLKSLLGKFSINSIDVILHAAGIAAKGTLNDKTPEDIIKVIQPKIHGVENLLKLAKLIQINYFVNCSSISSIIPSIGNIEYTSANLYLDELSYRSHSNIRYMLSIGLNQISDTGMAVDFINESTSDIGKIDDSIKSVEFPAILDILLQTKTVNNIFFSRYDLNETLSDSIRFLKDIKRNMTNESNVRIIKDKHTETELKIAQIWYQFLGVEEIGIHDNFFELGGNSLIATQVVSKIRNEYNIELSLKTFFENNTLKTLARIIENSKQQTEIIRIEKKKEPYFDKSILGNSEDTLQEIKI